MSKLICIDAGHGGRDSGAINGARYEKNDNLRLALALQPVLERQGFRVIQTRKDDSYVTLEQRSKVANSAKADLFISIHRNSFSQPDANGIENWVYQNTDQDTINMSTSIYNEVVAVAAQSKRGVKKGNFYVTRETDMRACLLELCFISNAKDNELYDIYFEKYVDAIAKGICKYFGVEFKPAQPIAPLDPEKPQVSQVMYSVQVGSFSVKENAERLAAELKSKGYACYINTKTV